MHRNTISKFCSLFVDGVKCSPFSDYHFIMLTKGIQKVLQVDMFD